MPEAPAQPSVIAALATAPGNAPRAILRLSGPGTGEVLDQLLDQLLDQSLDEPIDNTPSTPGPHRARISLGDRQGTPTTLPVLLLRFVAPRSYTGEDAAEILTVSNPALLARLLDRVTAIQGVRLAGPGEFTARAYLANRLTLAQAEGVAATINAETHEQLRAADRLLSGRAGETYHRWADELATLLALVEAGVDFTDQEDVVPIKPRELADRIASLHALLVEALGPEPASERASSSPRVVLAGVPNAGKSTLFNALLGRPRAVVSDTPGTTRDALEEPLSLASARAGAGEVVLIDPAGLAEPAAADGTSIDAMAQAAAREAIAGADLVLQCDPTGRFAPLPGVVTGTAILRVRTKADLPSDADLVSGGADIEVCALDGYHLPVLMRAIADAASASGGSGGGSGGAALVPRHRRAMVQAAANLLGSFDAIDPEARVLAEPELVAGELRLALNALAELVGDITPDDVIGRVFATFCVGK
ncbi:MAG: tRNA modification GTPase [Phycisphaerales bacterium]|jgi:tRNA modification GTPase